ncbi:translation elongation factor Ts [Candidatus Dependentiae bacterium]
MAKITTEMIKELREKTQVGMMECKKALTESDGNIEKAIELLRKKGAAVAAKRADKATNNGHIESNISDDLKSGVLLKTNCETDFSAKTIDMKDFSKRICKHIITTHPECAHDDALCLLEQKLFDDEKIKINDLLNELIAKIGEKIKVEEFVSFKIDGNGLVDSYIHPGANLGVLIAISTDKELEGSNQQSLKQLAHDVCMQIAVTNPISIDPDGIPTEILEKEFSIIKAQLAASNKPKNLIEKISQGKLNKYYEEVCLLSQKFIKDDKITIQKQIEKIEKETGLKIKIENFSRLSVGK